jgi:hypothetical protein
VKKVGIGEQNMSPVVNSMKNHPHPESALSPCPVPAAAWRGDEIAESAAMCEKDVSLPTRAKTSLLQCGKMSVRD